MELTREAPWRNVRPLVPDIRQGDVHIWWVCLDQDEERVTTYFRILDAKERDRAHRFCTDLDSYRYVVSHGVLRELLSAYTRTPAQSIRFDQGCFGKPVLHEQIDGEGLSFNVSHSGGMGVYAVTRDRRVGVDIEQLRVVDDRMELAKKFFNVREYEVLCSVGVENNLEFIRYWTCKEAYIKAKGEGLSYELDRFAMDLSSGDVPRLILDDKDPNACSQWTLRELAEMEGYRGAFCVEGELTRLRIAEWS